MAGFIGAATIQQLYRIARRTIFVNILGVFYIVSSATKVYIDYNVA